MITGIIHKGSGLGDQLFSYIATRVRAADLGVDFGFIGKEFFKGKDFLDLDWGKEPEGKEYLGYHIEQPSGALVFDDPMVAKHAIFKVDKPYFDPEFDFIEDGTVIDGYGAQDLRYFQHNLYGIKQWTKTEPLEVDNDTCIINFRGGEFAAIPELFLPQEYWETARALMHGKIPGVHTDDPDLAVNFFPDCVITKDISANWRSLRNARHAVISNSAFAIIPRLLKHFEDPKAVTIAPRYWARRNEGYWHNTCNYYPQFTYI